MFLPSSIIIYSYMGGTMPIRALSLTFTLLIYQKMLTISSGKKSIMKLMESHLDWRVTRLSFLRPFWWFSVGKLPTGAAAMMYTVLIWWIRSGKSKRPADALFPKSIPTQQPLSKTKCICLVAMNLKKQIIIATFTVWICKKWNGLSSIKGKNQSKDHSADPISIW